MSGRDHSQQTGNDVPCKDRGSLASIGYWESAGEEMELAVVFLQSTNAVEVPRYVSGILSEWRNQRNYFKTFIGKRVNLV